MADAKRHGAQEQVHRTIPSFARHVFDGVGTSARAGIVEEDVQAAERVLRRLHGRANIVLARHVAMPKRQLAVEAPLQLAALVVLYVGGDHARALGNKEFGCAEPDARTGARNDGNFVLQAIQILLPIRC